MSAFRQQLKTYSFYLSSPSLTLYWTDDLTSSTVVREVTYITWATLKILARNFSCISSNICLYMTTRCKIQTSCHSNGNSQQPALPPFLCTVFLGPRESTPKWHLDQFSHFCSQVQLTNRQTTLHQDICSNSPHLCT